MSQPTHLTVFVATRRRDVPASCSHFISVDGSVPGAAVTWDHHITGESINLEAMPDRFDTTGFDGAGTTHADTDAVASIVAVLFGGKASLPPDVLEILSSASYRCDHLLPHPDLPASVNELGRGLHGFVASRLRQGDGMFSSVSLELAKIVAARDPLPHDTSQQDAHRQAARLLEQSGRIRVMGSVAVVDLCNAQRIDPEAVYERLESPVSLFVETRADGGIRYTVGVNPSVRTRVGSLRPVLERLAAAEFAHGPPALRPQPGPGSENWGGRDTVFGSPWNYGSRLGIEEVVQWIGETIR
jgi:hypothetical protein